MSSVLMTSTMKSEPAGPLARGTAGGTPVSAAATAADGGNAEGRGAPVADVAEVAALAIPGAAAPATATPARNFRRLTFGCVSLCAMGAPFCIGPGAVVRHPFTLEMMVLRV